MRQTRVTSRLSLIGFALAILGVGIALYPRNTQLAKQLMASGKVDQAASRYRQEIEQGSLNPIVLEQAALTLEAQDDCAGSVAARRRLTTLDPKNPVHWRELARLYRDDMALSEYLECLERTVQLAPADAEAMFNLAGIYRRKQQADKLRGLLPSLVALTEDKAKRTALFSLAKTTALRYLLMKELVDLALGKHDAEAASMWLDRLLAENPQDLRAWQRRLEVAYALGGTEALLAVHSRMLANTDDQQGSWLAAQTMVGADQPLVAIDVLVEALLRNPNQPSLVGLLKDLAWSTPMPKQIVKQLHRLVDDQDSDPEIISVIVNLHETAKQPQQALKYATLLATLNPNDKATQTLVIDLLLESNQQQQAVDRLRQLAEQEPADHATIQRLAKLLEWGGDLAGATTVYERLVQLDPDNLADLLDTIRVLRWQNRDREATAYLDRASRLKPDDAELLEQLGLLARSTGQLELAANALRRLATIRDKNVSVLRQLAEIEVESGNLEAATVAWRAAQALAPTDSSLLRELATLAGWQEDYNEEVVWRLRLLQRQPDDEPNVLRIAELFLGFEGADAALVAILEEYLGRHPECEPLHRMLVTYHREYGDMQRAAALLVTLNAARPDDLPVAEDTVRTMAALGRTQEARAGIVRMLTNRPNQLDPVKRGSQLALEYGYLEVALSGHRRWVELEPTSFEASSYAGRLALWLGRAKLARPYLAHALKQVPTDGELHFMLAEAIDSTEPGATQADLHYRQARRYIRSVDKERLLMHARASSQLGDNRSALKTLRPLVRKHPQDPNVLLAHARTLVASREPEFAAKQASYVLKNFPKHEGDALRVLALAETQSGQTQSALERYRSILRLSPNDLVALRNCATLLKRSGQWAEAASLYRRIIELERADHRSGRGGSGGSGDTSATDSEGGAAKPAPTPAFSPTSTAPKIPQPSLIWDERALSETLRAHRPRLEVSDSVSSVGDEHTNRFTARYRQHITETYEALVEAGWLQLSGGVPALATHLGASDYNYANFGISRSLQLERFELTASGGAKIWSGSPGGDAVSPWLEFDSAITKNTRINLRADWDDIWFNPIDAVAFSGRRRGVSWYVDWSPESAQFELAQLRIGGSWAGYTIDKNSTPNAAAEHFGNGWSANVTLSLKLLERPWLSILSYGLTRSYLSASDEHLVLIPMIDESEAHIVTLYNEIPITDHWVLVGTGWAGQDNLRHLALIEGESWGFTVGTRVELSQHVIANAGYSFAEESLAGSRGKVDGFDVALAFVF